MREIRPSGSEGGAAQTNASSLPLLQGRPAAEESSQIRIKASPALDHRAAVDSCDGVLPGVRSAHSGLL